MVRNAWFSQDELAVWREGSMGSVNQQSLVHHFMYLLSAYALFCFSLCCNLALGDKDKVKKF